MKTGLVKILLLIGIAAFLTASEARAGVVFTSIFSLPGNSDATLVQSSNGTYLYGTTIGTGLLSSFGTVFAAPTNGTTSVFEKPTYTNLLTFTASDGGTPHAGVIIGPQNILYGVTTAYAISNTLFPTGMGSVFSLHTNSLFTRLYRFGTNLSAQGQPLDGANPQAPLVSGPSNYLYGTTYRGGSNGYSSGGLGYGTVFKITTNGTFTPLHSFVGSDGANPTGLAFGLDTNLYGVTSYGGSNTTTVDTNHDVGFGTIYKITTNGLLTTLYSFGAVVNAAGNALDGASPNTLIQGTDGNFYGTTTYGGSNTTVVDSRGDAGYGTVFRITTNGVLTSLYSFGAVTNSKGTPLDGANPAGPLAQGPDGNFYGTTEYGGATNTGTIFVITPAGALTTLYVFGPTNSDIFEPPVPPAVGKGSYPASGVMVGADYNLYGTSYLGGLEETFKGSIFRLGPAAPDIVTAPGNATKVAGATNTFSVGVNALYPTSYQWQFNGTNLSDGGEFSGSATTNLTLTGVALTNSGTYTILASNVAGTAKASGALTVVPAAITQQPSGRMVVVGATNTFTVGVNSIFPVSYQWQFDGTNLTDGGLVSGSSTSNLTMSGVILSNSGTYSVTVSNAAGVVHSAGAVLTVEPFNVTSAPSSLTIMAGMTATFGVMVQNTGAIYYQWQVDGANLTDGGNISGSSTSTLTLTNAVVNEAGTYSVIISNSTGTEALSAILSIFPQTAAGYSLASVHSFNSSTDGEQPNGLTLGSDGALYGTTTYGGSNGLLSGTFFKFTTNGALTTLYSFTGGSDEANPNSTLVRGSNGVFFGTTSSQISGQYGTVFEATTNGTLTTLAYFDETNGASPDGVTLGEDGNLYGAANQGGDNGAGTIFTVNPATTALNVLLSCSAVSVGNFPTGGLALGSDGNFYGGTESGVFEVSTNGTPLASYFFTGTNSGLNPLGLLLQASNGLLYGTTAEGGANGDGAVFDFTTNGSVTTLYSFGSVTYSDGSVVDGIMPTAGLTQGPDGNLYGTTLSGGYEDYGTVFRITTNGVFTTVAWFDGTNGSDPGAPLTVGADGNLYGTTQSGGTNGAGTIFRLVILPPPPPQIQLVSAGGGLINMVWSVTAGQTYQLQYSADLSQAKWTNLNATIPAASAQLNVSDSLAQTHRFYRLTQLPAP